MVVARIKKRCPNLPPLHKATYDLSFLLFHYSLWRLEKKEKKFNLLFIGMNKIVEKAPEWKPTSFLFMFNTFDSESAITASSFLSTNKNAPEAPHQVKILIDDRKFFKAMAVAVKLLRDPFDAYQLLVDSHGVYLKESHHRELDLDINATTTIKYSVDDVEFSKEHFASNYKDRGIVTRLFASKPEPL
ncbi:hypothetical protein RJT34_14872 [Clitoria ternatea]|uniref:Uncharacterized protein n=1 Tax=Clitoria ternatea TaxID=43366 RepID=A0AAN9JR42_CLITE